MGEASSFMSNPLTWFFSPEEPIPITKPMNHALGIDDPCQSACGSSDAETYPDYLASLMNGQ